MRIRRQLAGSGRPFAKESATDRAVLVSAPQRSVHRFDCRAMAGPAKEKGGGAGTWQPGPPRLSRDLEALEACYFYFPDWLLERRKCADKAVDSVVAASYLLGVAARRMERLVKQSITRLSKSQISVIPGGRLAGH